MIDAKEIANLIYLLDDTDTEVVEQIQGIILSYGYDALPFLEEAAMDDGEVLRLERLNFLIQELKKTLIVRDLKNWRDTNQDNLLEALLIVERIEFPHVDAQTIQNKLDKIRLDAWLEFKYDLTSFEQIKVLNYVFFKVHKFKGNEDNYHGVDNSFLSKVLDNKTGNPVSLGIIYALIAQRLNIPVYGVNLPQHFVLGYKSVEGVEILKSFNEESSLINDEKGEVMFYINPFTEGLILNGESIRSFLEQLKIEPDPKYFGICSNLEIVKRVLRNLAFSYGKAKNEKKSRMVKNMLDQL